MEITLNFWIIFGLIGQLSFTFRFLIQWIYSEIKKESTIPFLFWIFSIIGSSILLAYAIYRLDIVFILGQCFGIIVYSRNICLILRKRKAN